VERRARHDHVYYLDVLFHPGERRIELDAVEMFDHLRAAGAEADDHAAVAELVQRAEMLRERGRRARVDVDDRSRELSLARVLGKQRQQRKGVAAPRLGDPDRMDSRLVGNLRAFDYRLEIELALPVNTDC